MSGIYVEPPAKSSLCFGVNHARSNLTRGHDALALLILMHLARGDRILSYDAHAIFPNSSFLAKPTKHTVACLKNAKYHENRKISRSGH